MNLMAAGMAPRSIHDSFDLLSEQAKIAIRDLESIGYDVNALVGMNMSDERIIDLRDKAFQSRGIKVSKEATEKRSDDFAAFIGLGIDLSLESSPEQAKKMVKHLFYLAERELSQS